MSPNDPTLQVHQAAEPSARADDNSRPVETSPAGTADPQSTAESSTDETVAALGVSEGGGPTQTSTSDQGTAHADPAPPETESVTEFVATTTPPTVIATTDQAPPTDSETSGGGLAESEVAPANAPDASTEGGAETSTVPGAVEPPPPAISDTAAAEQPESTPQVPPAPEETSSGTMESTSDETTASPDSSTPDDAPKRRVTLDRTATESAAESTGQETAGGLNQQTAGSNAPTGGVEIPKSAELDPAMEQELERALSGPTDSPAEAASGENAGGAAQPIDIESLEPGSRLKGTVHVTTAETIFVDLGLRSPGMMPTRQLPEGKQFEVGQEIEVIVDKVDVSAATLTVTLPRARRKPAGNWDAVTKGQIVDAMVTKTNKGGLEVTVSHLRGFLPASQVDLGFVENLEVYVGQKVTCVITEVNPKKRNLVLSRRAYLHQERREKEKELWQSLEKGQQHTGTVKTIKDYGAFVDLGGVDGFLHVGEISWNRISHPSDVLAVGQSIEVTILKLDPESRKIGLGMKQLQANPWANVQDKYPLGATVSGKITRCSDFGAFVALEEGVEGLIHISELDHRRVGRVTEVVNEGEEVDVKVLAVEPKRKRIGLSLKALKDKPEPAKSAAPDAPAYERKRKEPLRGGREGQESGSAGLFGNPDDFR